MAAPFATSRGDNNSGDNDDDETDVDNDADMHGDKGGNDNNEIGGDDDNRVRTGCRGRKAAPSLGHYRCFRLT